MGHMDSLINPLIALNYRLPRYSWIQQLSGISHCACRTQGAFYMTVAVWAGRRYFSMCTGLMLSILPFANYITYSFTNPFSTSETHPCLFCDLYLFLSVTHMERSVAGLKNSPVVPGGENALEKYPSPTLLALIGGAPPTWHPRGAFWWGKNFGIKFFHLQEGEYLVWHAVGFRQN